MNVRLKPLAEQVIVITGASSGIGLVTARQASRLGARLVLVARNEDALRQLSGELNSQGGETIHVVADVSDQEQVRRVGEVALRRFGGFDTWMNLAGVGIFGACEEVPTLDARRLFDVNFWGVVFGSLVAVGHLRRHGGALINMGSEVSDRALPLQGIYSASKHAVKGYTDALRDELEEEGAPVSVTLVKPSAVATQFVDHAANYMDQEPRLAPPVYAPEIAAEVLLHAATHAVRDLYVGGAARLMAVGAHYAPRLLDKSLGGYMRRFAKSGSPSRARSDHTLYHPGTDLRERGTTGWRTHEHSLYTQAELHPTMSRAAVLGAGLALLTLWQMRKGRVV